MDNLFDTFLRLKREAGQARGPDGLPYSDLARCEVGDLTRALADQLRDRSYRPGHCRSVPIPKTSGKGHRMIRIAALGDRVVASALHQALAPFWELVFLPGSFGYRIGRGTWHLLADLERTMLAESRWVLAVDDIKGAFDHIVIADVLEDHRRYLGDSGLLWLVETVLRGSGRLARKIAIDQGGAYSPVALNVRLHRAHDIVMDQETGRPPWYRYADNLLYAAGDFPEARRTLAKSRQLHRTARLTLKGEDPTADLRLGETAQVLGFTLSSHAGRLRYELGPAAWAHLRLRLERVHREGFDPSVTAAAAVRGGWRHSGRPSKAG